MDANPQEDVLPHESQTLNPRKSEHKQDPQVSVTFTEEAVINTVLDVCGETESQSTDSGRQFFGPSRCAEDTRSPGDKGVESDYSHDLSFASDISIKNKNLIGLIQQSKKRHSSLSSLCDRINLLNIEDEDSFENNTQGNIHGDELITNGKHEDLEEYFPASTIKSEESSGEFLPAVSTIKFDETCVSTEESFVTEESEQLFPAVSKIKFDDNNINESANESNLTKDLSIKDTVTETGTNKSFEETVLKSVVESDKNTNELPTEKIKSTDDLKKHQSVNVSDIDEIDVNQTADSDNQVSSAKQLSELNVEGNTVNSVENINSASTQIDEPILVNKSGDELLNIQTENIGKTSPGLSIKLNSINTSLKETTDISEEVPSIEISNVDDIKNSKKHSEVDSTKTPENSPSKLLEISVYASPNELDKTTSCINEDDLSFSDSSCDPKDSEDGDLSSKYSSNALKSSSAVSANSEINLDSTFIADSDSNASFTISNDTTPVKIETPCLNTTNKNVSITGSPKAAVISECMSTETTFGSPNVLGASEITKGEENTKHIQIITVSESTSTEFPGLVSISQSTDTKDLTESPNIVGVSQSTNTTNISAFSNVVSVSQSTNTDDNLNSESEDRKFGPDTNSNFKMSDMVEKLNQQQAEISDLKLKLNAAQQHNASLELQIRQNEEIVIKAQAEALRTEQNYQQEVKQLKQKINENSKIIEKDRIRELEEQLKEAKAREAKLLAELSQRAKDDVNYQKIMDQYEITLKNRVSETKKLQEENDTIRTHLTNLELAFSDVHSKYEKTKASLHGVKANEEGLLQDLDLAQSTNIQHEERYESLKAHARTQIEKSNKEIHDVKEHHELEISKLRAFVRRLEIKVSSLEVSLQQKSAECEQLSALCDEVTGKKV